MPASKPIPNKIKEIKGNMFVAHCSFFKKWEGFVPNKRKEERNDKPIKNIRKKHVRNIILVHNKKSESVTINNT